MSSKSVLGGRGEEVGLGDVDLVTGEKGSDGGDECRRGDLTEKFVGMEVDMDGMRDEDVEIEEGIWDAKSFVDAK